MDFFKKPIKKGEELLTMFALFEKENTSLYGKFTASFPLIYSRNLTIFGVLLFMRLTQS